MSNTIDLTLDGLLRPLRQTRERESGSVLTLSKRKSPSLKPM